MCPFSTASGLGIASCDISWTPNASQINNNSYNIAFRISEKHGVYTYVSDKTIQFQVITPLAVKEISKGNVVNEIYPNPSNGILNLTLPPTTQNCTFTIFNTNGQIVAKGSNTLNQINLTNLPTGMYSLQLTTADGKTSTTKFVRQ